MIILLATATFACGQSGGSASPTSGGASPTGNGAHGQGDASAENHHGDGGADANAELPPQSCCVGGEYYVCPDSASVARCSGFDLSSCLQKCSGTDDACSRSCSDSASHAQIDSSACKRDTTHDAVCPKSSQKNGTTSTHTSSSSDSSHGGGSSGGGALPTPKNACGGQFLGIACDAYGACNAGGHCTNGSCFPNEVGNPCTFPTDCGNGNHCVNGCCTDGSAGSACGTGMDCQTQSCGNGVCQ